MFIIKGAFYQTHQDGGFANACITDDDHLEEAIIILVQLVIDGNKFVL